MRESNESQIKPIGPTRLAKNLQADLEVSWGKKFPESAIIEVNLPKNGKALRELGRIFGKTMVFCDIKEGFSPWIGEIGKRELMNSKQSWKALKIIYLKITFPIKFYRSFGLICECIMSIREASTAMEYSFKTINTKLSFKRSVETITELSRFHKKIEKALAFLKIVGL